MAVYDRRGDNGKTTLNSPTPIAKDDIRLHAIGDCEELCAVLSLCAPLSDASLSATLSRVQETVGRIVSFIHSGGMATHLPTEADIAYLDDARQQAETSASNEAKSAPCELSARLVHAYTVSRRCERSLVHMEKVYPTKKVLDAYMNRLSSLLFALSEAAKKETAGSCPPTNGSVGTARVASASPINTDALVCEVLHRLGGNMLNLADAKALIEAIVAEAKKMGKAAVVAVCNAEGNPIAVNVMDGAFLVSFDVAVKKAYSAVAVKMPTIELSKLVVPGGTFAGLDAVTDLVTFGGGVPLFRNGTLVGGLGVSGGTGEEDHELAQYGLDFFDKM